MLRGINRRDLVVTLALIAIVAALWHQVFVMTGVLWWNAPTSGIAARPAPPPPLTLKPPDVSGVNLGAYLRTHPTWEP